MSLLRMAMEAVDKTKLPKKGIGKIEKGAFHKWLGKSPTSPITDADIERGLKSKDPHVNKMALFARNAKKWADEKKKTAGKKK